MPLNPAINVSVNITAKDINGNNVAKVFNSVTKLHFDYSKGTVNVVDVTGSFYFSLMLVTTLTYTVVAGFGAPTTTVVIS